MLLIKNVKVIDGSGKPAYPADILVVGDKISAIGNFTQRQADQVIEGLGAYLVPGFIDVGAEADHYLTLFDDPLQGDCLAQGVTTIIGGRCGSSLAPLLYGSLESIRKWVDTSRISVDWTTVEELLRVLKKVKLGVNFGTLIGHSTIRRALIGEEQRDLTEKELKIFQSIIKEALEEGALGFSTGLGFAHSRQTPYKELKLLTAILSRYNAVHAVHLRDEEKNIFASVNEIIKLYRETGTKTIISHFRPLKRWGKEFDASLNLLNKTAALMDIYFDLNLSAARLLPLYALLPLWAQKGDLEVMAAQLKKTETARKIFKEIKIPKGELAIAKALGNSLFLRGKIINSIKDLKEIIKLTDLRALVRREDIDLERLEKTALLDKSLITSGEKGINKFLDLVNRRRFPLERAIAKLTGQAAQRFNLRKRGVIKEGNFADLVILLNNRVYWVLVNGQIAIYKGALKQVFAGQIVTK